MDNTAMIQCFERQWEWLARFTLMADDGLLQMTGGRDWGGVARVGGGGGGGSGGLVVCLFDRHQTGLTERGARKVRRGRRGMGEERRRERRMVSARGHVHLTSGRVRVHTQQSRGFFSCGSHDVNRIY